MSAHGWLFTSTSHRGTLLGQLHHSTVCTPCTTHHFAFSASRGASQPWSVSFDTASHVSHCHNGQRAKAKSIFTRKSITKEHDIKELFKSAAWHAAGEAWPRALDLLGGSARRGAFAFPLTAWRRAQELVILQRVVLVVNKKVKLELTARKSL